MDNRIRPTIKSEQLAKMEGVKQRQRYTKVSKQLGVKPKMAKNPIAKQAKKVGRHLTTIALRMIRNLEIEFL